MIEISDEARTKIKEILDKHPGKYLRITVEGTGCGGPYLRLSLDEAGSYESPVEVNGIHILVSDDVQKYVENTTVKIFSNQTGEDLL